MKTELHSSNVKKRHLPIFEWALPVFCILQYYTYGFLSVGLIMIYVLTALCFYADSKWYIYKPIVYFLIYILFNNLIKMLFIQEVSSEYYNTILEKIASFLVLVAVSSRINENQLYKSWTIVAVPVLAGMVFQSFMAYGLQKPVSPIPILPISSEMARTWAASSLRPSSLFPEPAAFIWFMLPLLFLAIKRRKYVFAIIITMAIFLSTSTTGILLSFLLWLAFSVFTAMRRKEKILIMTLVISFVLLLALLNVFTFAKEKLVTTNIEESFRLGYGFRILSTMPKNQWLFGVPYSSVASYITDSGNVPASWYDIRIPYFSFVNSFCQNFIEYGLIGTILYLNLFFALYRRGNKGIRPLLLAAFASIWGESVSFGSGIFMIQFAVMIALDKNKDLSKNYIVLHKEGWSNENCYSYDPLCQ